MSMQMDVKFEKEQNWYPFRLGGREVCKLGGGWSLRGVYPKKWTCLPNDEKAGSCLSS